MSFLIIRVLTLSADLQHLTCEIADALVTIDRSKIPFKHFKPGVGPYGEPQLIKDVSKILNSKKDLKGLVITKRTPDLLIKGLWALEFKIARPFGDNGIQAESWSVNLLHPYEGNVSSIGDCVKLLKLNLPEKKAVIVIGYEHEPPEISLKPLIESFEIISTKVMHITLGARIEENRKGLIHPIHQQLTVFAWEVLTN
jgi:hypothetical protein